VKSFNPRASVIQTI